MCFIVYGHGAGCTVYIATFTYNKHHHQHPRPFNYGLSVSSLSGHPTKPVNSLTTLYRFPSKCWASHTYLLIEVLLHGSGIHGLIILSIVEWPSIYQRISVRGFYIQIQHQLNLLHLQINLNLYHIILTKFLSSLRISCFFGYAGKY